MRFATANAALLALSGIAAAVPALTVKGSDFINEATGNRFQIVGVAYQPGGSSGYDPSSGIDPLSDGSVCLRDASLMQMLGVNAIRVYNVDPNLNHDECASIFNDVGIYMLLDVNSPLIGESINRAEPWTTYDADYLNRTFAVVEAFKSYPNTLLFFAGNEVINDVASGEFVPAYMRAVTRDLKNYIAKNSNRTIPVGYSAADVRSILVDTANYLTCTTTGDDTDPSRADVFALNSYSWCGASSYTEAGYDVIIDDFKNTTVPVFFSEFGCNEVKPRVFTEVQAIYGEKMSPVMSGGMVYEFTQETSDYGLIVVNSNGSAQIRTDFDNLQVQYNKLNFTSLQEGKPSDTVLSPVSCSASLITNKGFESSFTLPDVPEGVQDMIDNGITNAPVGQLVDITSTDVTQVVQDSTGKILTGLSITKIASDESNTPSGKTTSKGVTSDSTTSNTTSDSTSSSASTSASSTSSSSSTSSTVASSAAGNVQVMLSTIALSAIAAFMAL